MQIIEIFGDGRQLPNGWHRYIMTHTGTKWVHILNPNKLRLHRIRKQIFEGMNIKTPEQDWTFYRDVLPHRMQLKTMSGKQVAGNAVISIIEWIAEHDAEINQE